MNDRDEHELREMLNQRARDRFAPGFVNRTTARWRADRTAVDATIVRQFRRFGPLAAAAVVLLAVYNVSDRRDGRSVVASLFGMPAPITLDAIYQLGVSE
jgi:hypothetical protein